MSATTVYPATAIGRRSAKDVDRQVEMLAKAYRDLVPDGDAPTVALYREGRSWRLTVEGYSVTTWSTNSTTEVWTALLDMRRAVEAAGVVLRRRVNA